VLDFLYYFIIEYGAIYHTVYEESVYDCPFYFLPCLLDNEYPNSRFPTNGSITTADNATIREGFLGIIYGNYMGLYACAAMACDIDFCNS